MPRTLTHRPWPEFERDALAIVSETDRVAAVEAWRADAPPAFRRLLDAQPPDGETIPTTVGQPDTDADPDAGTV